MIAKAQFGKLGKRASARLLTQAEACLILPERTIVCQIDNVSRTGCRVLTDTPPRLGASVMLRVDRVEAFGHVVWVRHGRCGVAFDRSLEPNDLNRLRWIGENPDAHARNASTSAASSWR